jgi:hypothetical protein
MRWLTPSTLANALASGVVSGSEPWSWVSMVDGKPDWLAIEFDWPAGMLAPWGAARSPLVGKLEERIQPGIGLFPGKVAFEVSYPCFGSRQMTQRLRR